MRTNPRLSALILTLACFFACSKMEQKIVPPVAKQGQLEILLTDAPLPYTAVNVNVAGLEYNSSPDPGISSGWDSLPLKARGIINLLSLQNGDSAFLTNTSLGEVNIRQIRMKFIGSGNTVVVNGNTKPLVIPADILSRGVTIPVNYAIQQGQTRTIWIDFNAASSVKYDSAAGTYTLIPALRTFEPARSGRIIGQVMPQDAQVVVTVVKDSSDFRTTCYPDYTKGGYFSAVGLDSGSYKVYFTPANPLYRSRMLPAPRIYNTNHTFSLGTVNMSVLPYVSSTAFTGNWFVRESVRIMYPDSFVGLDSFFAPTIAVNDSTFGIVQTGRKPDPAWVQSWPYINADTLNFTPMVSGNVLKSTIQTNTGTYSSNKDTFNIKYFYGNGMYVYIVNQKWERR